MRYLENIQKNDERRDMKTIDEIKVKMKTIGGKIEERVRKYSPDSIWPDMVWQIRDEHLVDYRREAYIAGALEQKVIDDAELLKLKSELEEKEAQIKQQYKQGYHDAMLITYIEL